MYFLRNLIKKGSAFSPNYLIDAIKEEALGGSELADFLLNIPPDYIKADFTLTISDFQKVKELVLKINKRRNQFIKEAKQEGPFLNLYVDKQKIYGKILKEISKLKDNYGRISFYKGKRAFIEYSSPNIAKPMNVGHLRSTVIGEALARIYEYGGYQVMRVNYLGDWGTQFGKLLYAYKVWGEEKKIKKDPINELNKLYIKFQMESEIDESLNDKARDYFRKLEKGDKELVDLWKKFREMSITKFEEVYKRLGIKFDKHSGESFFAKSASDEIDKCLNKKVCAKGKGNSVIAEVENLPTFLLKKQDGTTLYLARDLAAIKYRIEKYKPNLILYVVGNDQALHFKQLFKLAERMGYLEKVIVKHISFGLVLLGGRKMSTRKGRFIELNDLLNEAVVRAKKIIEEKNPNLKEEERMEVAEIVGIGSIIYNDLRHSRSKNISFNWERMLNFESGSSAYLQYTYVRIQSLLNKAGFGIGRGFRKISGKIYFEKSEEFDVARRLVLFPQVILDSIKNDSPHFIAGYLENLAASFNNFYNNISVINTKDQDLKLSRLFLAESTAQIIKTGLNLLNIKVPRKM